MNTYNHHKVIEKVSEKLKNDNSFNLSHLFNVSLLERASDFTDDFCKDSEWESIKKGITNLQINQEKFFYFHFYYDLIIDKGKVGKGTISLKRRDEKNDYNQIDKSMGNCNYTSQFEKPPTCIDPMELAVHSNLMIQKNYKLFFTYINDREDFFTNGIFDSSNQSDCVAFLHAMSAKKDGNPQESFEDHLRKCFAEFLFLKNDNDALFVLGISLHSIMDSFTPSHMGFQEYTEQDMARHAQGDVIPFDDDTIAEFDPGQYTADGIASNGKTKMAALFKRYDSGEHLNDKEFDMFNIFAEIGDIANNRTIKDIINEKIDLTRIGKYNYKTDSVEHVKRSLIVLNDILLKKKIEYGKNAYVYSKAAVNACSEVFQRLSKARQEIGKNYEKYKKLKDKTIDAAIDCWKSIYESQELIEFRTAHLNKNLYKKDPSIWGKVGNAIGEMINIC